MKPNKKNTNDISGIYSEEDYSYKKEDYSQNLTLKTIKANVIDCFAKSAKSVKPNEIPP